MQNLYAVCRHLRAGSMKPKSLQTSVSERGPSVESFFGQPSNQLQPHLWSLGLPSVLAKTSQKAFSACKIVGGRSSAAGQSPVNNCIYSNKPGSKNNFPRCVQSPYSLPAMNRSGDPPCAEFPNSLPEKKELQIGIYQ